MRKVSSRNGGTSMIRQNIHLLKTIYIELTREQKVLAWT